MLFIHDKFSHQIVNWQRRTLIDNIFHYLPKKRVEPCEKKWNTTRKTELKELMKQSEQSNLKSTDGKHTWKIPRKKKLQTKTNRRHKTFRKKNTEIERKKNCLLFFIRQIYGEHFPKSFFHSLAKSDENGKAGNNESHFGVVFAPSNAAIRAKHRPMCWSGKWALVSDYSVAIVGFERERERERDELNDDCVYF